MQEDSMSVQGRFMGRPNQDLFGIFDGHGGSRVAKLCEEQFHLKLSESLTAHNDTKVAIISTFHAVDNLAKKYPDEGATAAVVYVTHDTLWVANAGDARVVLSHKTEGAVRLSTDHKPDLDSEKERIEALGGMVLCIFGTWRVQGALAVARAIGDERMSPYVTSTPTVKSVSLTQDCEFLVVACDGLWDVVSDEDAVEAVKKKPTASEAARYLTRMAYNKGSQDNISVMVVFLKDSFA